MWRSDPAEAKLASVLRTWLPDWTPGNPLHLEASLPAGEMGVNTGAARQVDGGRGNRPGHPQLR